MAEDVPWETSPVAPQPRAFRTCGLFCPGPSAPCAFSLLPSSQQLVCPSSAACPGTVAPTHPDYSTTAFSTGKQLGC